MIYNNEQADKAAKKAAAAEITDQNTDIIDYSNKTNISLIYLKREVKNLLLYL